MILLQNEVVWLGSSQGATRVSIAKMYPSMDRTRYSIDDGSQASKPQRRRGRWYPWHSPKHASRIRSLAPRSCQHCSNSFLLQHHRSWKSRQESPVNMSTQTSRTPGANRLSTVPPSASKSRQLSHLHAQLAQLTAHMSDLENLLRVTMVQAEAMRGLGGYTGGM